MVETATMESLTAVLAVAAGVCAIVIVALRIAGPYSAAANALGARVISWRGEVTLLVAGIATLGSLYFSEIAHYVPCRLCWFQRVAMYPIAVIALVGVIRRDAAARWYVLPLAALGITVSMYHYMIEWNPSLDTGSCALFGPACTDIWFRSFGFATLAFMALCGFGLIIVVNTVSFRTPQAVVATAAEDEDPS